MDEQRSAAWTVEIQNVHHLLETALGEARAELTRPGDTRRAVASSPLLHCYGFCAALSRHHESEDAVLFPRLLEQVPELEPVIAGLTEDHRVLSRLLAEFRAALDDHVQASHNHDTGQQDVLDRRLDELHLLMTQHFAAEELKLDQALDALSAPAAERERIMGL